jgi:hypothetical protein
MSNVNADIDRMKDFIQDIKRHRDDVISNNHLMIEYKLHFLSL